MFLKKSLILSCKKKQKKKSFGDVWNRSQYLQYTNSVLSSLGHWTELEIEANKLFINTTSLTLCSSFNGITQHSCVVWSSFCSPRCRVKVTLKRMNKIQFACYPKTNPNQLSTFNRTQFTYALFSVLRTFYRNYTLQTNSNKQLLQEMQVLFTFDSLGQFELLISLKNNFNLRILRRNSFINIHKKSACSN